MSKLKILNSVIVATMLAGCGSSPPDCSDSAVQKTVTELMDGTRVAFNMGVQLGSQLRASGIEVDATKVGYKLDAIRTESIDKNTNKSLCAANIQMLYAGKAYLEQSIRYSAQVTDNKKDVYVEIR